MVLLRNVTVAVQSSLWQDVMQTCTAEHGAWWLGSWRTHFFSSFFQQDPLSPPNFFDLSSDVKSQTFFELVCVWKISPVFWSATLSLYTRARAYLKSLLLSLAVLHLHIFSFLHLFFSFPPIPVGTSLFYVSLKGVRPPAPAAMQKEQRCFKRIP